MRCSDQGGGVFLEGVQRVRWGCSAYPGAMGGAEKVETKGIRVEGGEASKLKRREWRHLAART
jgi:hypothetical protein